MTTKKDLKDYITTVGKLKPSAEVKFKSVNEQGEVTESVASRTYVSNHIDKETDLVKKISGLGDRLNRVTENAAKAAAESIQPEEDDLDDLAQEVDDEQTLSENAAVSFRNAREPEDVGSPLTHVPNSVTNPKSTEEMSETAMLIKLISQLIDRVDAMQNFNPVIHVPAPVIHVTLPETQRTVTRAVERDDEGFIKSIREHVEEKPQGEPLIEVKQPAAKRKTSRSKPKDSE